MNCDILHVPKAEEFGVSRANQLTEPLRKISFSVKKIPIYNRNPLELNPNIFRPCFDPLLWLPMEVVLLIFTFLNTKDLLNISRVQKSFQQLLSDEQTWKYLYVQKICQSYSETHQQRLKLFHKERVFWRWYYLQVYSMTRTWDTILTLANEFSFVENIPYTNISLIRNVLTISYCHHTLRTKDPAQCLECSMDWKQMSNYSNFLCILVNPWQFPFVMTRWPTLPTSFRGIPIFYMKSDAVFIESNVYSVRYT